MAAFFSTLWGRILAVLTAIALLLGIAAEGVSLYPAGRKRSSIKVKSSKQKPTLARRVAGPFRKPLAAAPIP
jgi:hypothetical protein